MPTSSSMLIKNSIHSAISRGDLNTDGSLPTLSGSASSPNFSNIFTDSTQEKNAFIQFALERQTARKAIDEKLVQFPAFGAPTSELLTDAKGRGYFQHYQNGSIFWLASFGAHEVHGGIRDLYASLGWVDSFLAYPTSDELPRSQFDRYSQFENGTIEWVGGAARVMMSVDVQIENHQLGAWLHISGKGFTPGGTVSFSVEGLAGATGALSIGQTTQARADSTFANITWDGRTWSKGGAAVLRVLDEKSNRSITANIPAFF